MGDVAPVIAVTGLNREGAVLRGVGVRVISGGSDAARLERDLSQACENAAGIISFGMAGALDSSLALGNWVIGTRLTGAINAECDASWAAALAARLPQARRGAAYADGRLIGDPAAKRALGAAHGALVVDMESHIAAAVAARAGLPFALLRCVSDRVETEIPEAIAMSMRADGGVAMGAVLGSLARKPGQIRELLVIGKNFARVYRALGAGARAAGWRLAFDEGKGDV